MRRRNPAKALEELPPIHCAGKDFLPAFAAEQPLRDNARRIAAGGGLAGLRLDQPGIDQDQAVEPRRRAEQGERGGAVAQAEADDPLQRRALARGRRRRRPRGPARCPGSPDPRRRCRRPRAGRSGSRDNPFPASALASLSYMRCEPIRVWLPPVTSSSPVGAVGRRRGWPPARRRRRRRSGAGACAAPFDEVGGDRLGELGRSAGLGAPPERRAVQLRVGLGPVGGEPDRAQRRHRAPAPPPRAPPCSASDGA